MSYKVPHQRESWAKSATRTVRCCAVLYYSVRNPESSRRHARALTLEHWNTETLKLWDTGTMEQWNTGPMEQRNNGSMKLWNHKWNNGMIGQWDNGTREQRNNVTQHAARYAPSIIMMLVRLRAFPTVGASWDRRFCVGRYVLPATVPANGYLLQF